MRCVDVKIKSSVAEKLLTSYMLILIIMSFKNRSVSHSLENIQLF